MMRIFTWIMVSLCVFAPEVFGAAAPMSDGYEYYDDAPETLGRAQIEKAEKEVLSALTKTPDGFARPIALIKEKVLSPEAFLSFLSGDKGVAFEKSIMIVPSEGEGNKENMVLAEVIMGMSAKVKFIPAYNYLFPRIGAQGKIMIWVGEDGGKKEFFKVSVCEACSFETSRGQKGVFPSKNHKNESKK